MTRKEQLAFLEQIKYLAQSQGTLLSAINNLRREMEIDRARQAAFVFGRLVADNDEVDLENIREEEETELAQVLVKEDMAL